MFGELGPIVSSGHALGSAREHAEFKVGVFWVFFPTSASSHHYYQSMNLNFTLALPEKDN